MTGSASTAAPPPAPPARRRRSVTSPTYTDTTAVTGTRYYYAVAAVDAAGNEGAKSPESSAIAVDNPSPALGLRRHLRVRGRRLDPTSGWTLSGTPQRAEYDTARAKNGTLSGWIQGPTTAAAAGASIPAVMTSNGAEYRFWMYTDTANENRYVTDTGSVFELRTDTTGKHGLHQAHRDRVYRQRLHRRRHLRRRAGPSTASCSTSRETPTRSPSAPLGATRGRS